MVFTAGTPKPGRVAVRGRAPLGTRLSVPLAPDTIRTLGSKFQHFAQNAVTWLPKNVSASSASTISYTQANITHWDITPEARHTLQLRIPSSESTSTGSPRARNLVQCGYEDLEGHTKDRAAYRRREGIAWMAVWIPWTRKSTGLPGPISAWVRQERD